MRNLINEYVFYMIKLVSYLHVASSPHTPFSLNLLNLFINFVVKLLVLPTSLIECPCCSMTVIQLLVIIWALGVNRMTG